MEGKRFLKISKHLKINMSSKKHDYTSESRGPLNEYAIKNFGPKILSSDII
jgi:hypothetical protein